MSSVGSYLRDLRERRGISLEEIARSTRVLHRYLEALEADDFMALPALVFTKGFIRAYCQALGVAPDEALALYEERRAASGEGGRPAVDGARAAPAAEPVLVTRKRREESGRPENRARGAVLASFVMLVVLGLALFAVTFWLQPPREHRAAAPAGEQKSIPGPAAQAPKAGAPAGVPARDRRAPAAARPEAALPAPAAPDAPLTLASVTSPYRLVARTSELTWIRVRTEDGRTSEENIPPGETREWVSNRPFVLTIGNAGGVALELNGRRVPPLGPRGAVIERLVLPSESQ
ncbi:MAG: helix-turn-helix domain-containing protein [Candidatus Rokubacteria bacterium]|nr:helix-turn-helix domain-containing protein [Candidatus Rokubacteria bacterium]